MIILNRTNPTDAAEPKPHPGRPMSEEEFVEWCDEDTTAEWVDGEVILMAPASDPHDDLNVWLLTILRAYADHRALGLVRGSNLQVRLAGQRQRRVPDVLFVAKDRRSIVKPNHVEGPPDLVMEIVRLRASRGIGGTNTTRTRPGA